MNTKDPIGPEQTWEFVENVFVSHFGEADTSFLRKIFEGVEDLFAGRYAGYQCNDAAYHDFTHTCEATVALVRILDGHLKSGELPALGRRDFELAVAASLLHDSGYMKQVGDDGGTGAKYTLTHIERSGDFAAEFLPKSGVTPDEIRTVQLAIDCTGVKITVEPHQFRNEREYLIGCALGAGDILGQMGAPEYPERLSRLYHEFAEAAQYSGGKDSWISTYTSTEDLLNRTRAFYEDYVKTMLDSRWGGVHAALSFHFEDGQNHYLTAIENNLDRIDRMLQGNPA